MEASNTVEISIPVIDISNEDAQTGIELVDAVEKWGFVFVRGEGLGFKTQDIEGAFQLVGSQIRVAWQVIADAQSSLASFLAPRLKKKGNIQSAPMYHTLSSLDFG